MLVRMISQRFSLLGLIKESDLKMLDKKPFWMTKYCLSYKKYMLAVLCIYSALIKKKYITNSLKNGLTEILY